MPVPRKPANPERWFRTHPDSSELPRPRLLARSLIDAAELDDQIAAYEQLLGVPADLRMPIPDFGGLELAAVGNLLLIASVRPFTPVQRHTAYSLIVPSLEEQLESLRGTGTTVLEPPEAILPGARARVRYRDGLLAELVEHRPWSGEIARPAQRGGLLPTGIRLMARRAVPRGAFSDTVELYETLLRTPAVARPLVGSRPAETVTVGNLLLVSSPTDAPETTSPRMALIVTSPHHTRMQQLIPDVHEETALLPGGVAAEVWSEPAAADGAAGLPHAPQAAAQGSRR